jgi:hypothetical protein
MLRLQAEHAALLEQQKLQVMFPPPLLSGVM